MTEGPDIEINVETPLESEPDNGGDTDVVVVTPPADTGSDSDIALIVGALTERVNGHENRIAALEAATVSVETIADVALETAIDAADTADDAVETATEIAEEADEPEPPDEPPGKTHWLNRSLREWTGKD